MDFHQALLYIQHSISFAGVIVILSGVLLALYRYIKFLITVPSENPAYSINAIRLTLGRVLVLGLEFIVGADLIGTTTAPDYYSIGIVACIVAIRTVLSFTLNREIAALSEEEATQLPK